jgi:hypothetical protein
VVFGLRNEGLSAALPWQVQLTSTHSGVVILPSAGILGPIAAGQTGWTTPYTLLFADEIANGTIIPFLLTGEGPSSFAESFSITMEMPALAFEGIVTSGDEIIPRIVNRGSTSALNVTATLTSLGGGGSVLDGMISIGRIEARSSAAISDGFHVVGPPNAKFLLQVSAADGAPIQRQIDRERPQAVAQLRSAPRENGAMIFWSPSPSSDVAGYRLSLAVPPALGAMSMII